MPRRSLRQLWAAEFTEYSLAKFRQDLLAGLTVAAVALPLALAFGVASGASAAAGMVTAILAGLIIGALSGAPYQISGPTGAMSAILIVLAAKYGLAGIWVAGVFSGILLLIIGALRLGRFIAFIPAPVITGFTSGIALIISIGQIDNFFGIKTPNFDSALEKLVNYTILDFSPNLEAVLVSSLVVFVMIYWPKKLAAICPGSLLGIVVATLVSWLLSFQIDLVGEIPRTLFLTERLEFSEIPWSELRSFLAPTLSIAALGAIESLLCGAVASNMTGIRLQANQELIAQGVGNIIIPFFGGVPATAAIARSSVGIKSGGQTRLTGIIHALALLASIYVLAPVMSKIPLAALAGVLMVTAWRMNEWEAIRFIFGRKFRTAILTFAITMIATVALDLTQAILIGAVISAAVFISQISNIDINLQTVDPEKLRQRGVNVTSDCKHIRVAYLTGPLFFAAVGHFNEAFAKLGPGVTLILSMRGMPFVDTSGLQAVLSLLETLRENGGRLMFAGVHDDVMEMFERGGLVGMIGKENVFWSSDQAIQAAQLNSSLVHI